VNVSHQGDILFATVVTYEAAGASAPAIGLVDRDSKGDTNAMASTRARCSARRVESFDNAVPVDPLRVTQAGLWQPPTFTSR